MKLQPADFPMQSSLTAPRYSALLVFSIATFAAGIFALLPIRVMLEHFIYEDMFYYLRVAQHLAEGNGSTFDGTAPTNGYHPAWMALSTFFALFLEDEALIRAMLLLAAVLHGAQATLIYRILSRYAPQTVALGVTALFALNWRVIATNLCGLETPLSLFLLLVIVNFLLQRTADDRSRVLSAITLGILIGLATYARFDMLLFGAIALAFVALVTWSEHGFWSAVRGGAVSTAVIGVSLIPWFLFSLSVSGVLLPNSREAVRLLGGGGPDFSSAEAAATWVHGFIFGSIHWVSDSANLLGLWPYSVPEGRLSQIAALILVLFLFWVLISGIRAARSLPKVFWFLVVFFILHSFYYALFYRLEVRYVLPAFTAVLLCFGLVLGQQPRGLIGVRFARAPLLLGAMFTIATVAGVDAWTKYHGTTRTHQGHAWLYDAALWIKENEPEAAVGSWNAGIMSFFSRAEVVNLDGVINDDALRANRAGEIDNYIAERGITLLADGRGQISGNLIRFAGNTELMGPVQIDYNGVVVLQVAKDQ